MMQEKKFNESTFDASEGIEIARMINTMIHILDGNSEKGAQ